MSLQDRKTKIDENRSHVCSAQSDSIISLQFDKQVKFRSYSSQFTLGDQVLVGIDRREEFKPIKDTVTVEVDLCTGICNNVQLTSDSKYYHVIRLEDMANQNAWVKKMTSYDEFVDKDVLNSIRDEAMEPNKLYLLSHQHKHQTSEKMAGNYSSNGGNQEKRKLRTTAAQFNPSYTNLSNEIDRMVYPQDKSNTIDVHVKSKNTLRNELIIQTGDFQSIPLEDDKDNYCTSLSIDLSKIETPKVTSSTFFQIVDLDDKIVNQVKKKVVEDLIVEEGLQQTHTESLAVDDIPFAEEPETVVNDFTDSSPSKISKSLQYFLPVFEPTEMSAKSLKSFNFEDVDNHSRDSVTTDENDSEVNTTDRNDIFDKEEVESLNPDDFAESVSGIDKQPALVSSNDDESLVGSDKTSNSYNESFDYDDIICQENMVIHIHHNTNIDALPLNRLPSSFKILDEKSYDPISQFDILRIESESAPPAPASFIKYSSRANIDPSLLIQYPRERETTKETAVPVNEDTIQSYHTAKEQSSETESFDSQSSLIIKEVPNDNINMFQKTRSFSLNRNSEKIDDFSAISTSSVLFNLRNRNNRTETKNILTSYSETNKDDNVRPTLFSDRKEKFMNADFNTTRLLFQPVSDDFHETNSPRSSSPENTESSKKNEISTNSSENSMVIKNVPSDDSIVLYKPPQNIGYEILEEELENETENIESTEEIYSEMLSTEEVPDKEKDISSNEDLSFYSTSTIATVNEITLQDLVKTPIDSTPGRFEKFLLEREKSIKPEVKLSHIEESSASIATTTETETSFDDSKTEENIIENNSESIYTEDTSSSSSDFPQNSNPILRQGESIENIEKYLKFESQDKRGLRRSSGFDSQLNVLNSEENNENNLLNYKPNDGKIDFSSDDNTNESSLHEQELTNETETPQKYMTSDNELSDHQSRISKEIAFKKENSQPRFIAKPINKQSSLPISVKRMSDPNSDSDDSDTLSTSTEEINSRDDLTVSPPAKFVDRNEKFIKQKSMPIKKTRMSSSSSESDSSDSVSTTEDENLPANKLSQSNSKFTDREEKFADKENASSVSTPRIDVHSPTSESESNRSLSTSSDNEYVTEDEKEDAQSKFIDREEKYIDKKKLPSITNSRKEIPDSSSDDESTRSLSSSKEEPPIQNRQSKFIEREENDINPQLVDRQNHIPISKVHYSSESESSRSLSTSTDELPIEKDDSVKEEELLVHPLIHKRVIIPTSQKRSSHSSGYSDSSTSLSSSTDELQKRGSNKPVTTSTDRKEIKFNKQISMPNLQKHMSSSSSTRSVSTSSEEGPLVKEVLQTKPANVREDRFTSKLIVKQKSLPDFQNNISDSSSCATSTESLSTTDDELSQTHTQEPHLKFTERKESFAEKQKSSPISKSLVTKSTDGYDISASLSFSKDVICSDNESEDSIKNFIGKNEKVVINPQLVDFQNASKRASYHSSSSQSLATSTEDISTEDDINKCKPNEVYNKEEIAVPQLVDRQLFIPVPKKRLSRSSTSNSSIKKNEIPPNIFIDRREKIEYPNETNYHANFTRSRSVPEYYEDVNKVSTPPISDDDKKVALENQSSTKFSQSSKIINSLSEENISSKRKRATGFELLSVILKDSIITRFIERRRKYVDLYNSSDTWIYPTVKQSPNIDNRVETPNLFVDREEKFVNIEQPGNIKYQSASSSDFSISSSYESELENDEIKLVNQINETVLPLKVNSTRSKLPESHQNKTVEQSEETMNDNKRAIIQFHNKQDESHDSISSNEEYDSDREENEYNFDDDHPEHEDQEIIGSGSVSISPFTSNEEENADNELKEDSKKKNSRSIDRLEKFTAPTKGDHRFVVYKLQDEPVDNNESLQSNFSKSTHDHNQIPQKFTDNEEQFPGMENQVHKLSRRKIENKESPTQSNMSSNYDDSKKKSKSIDRREKFAEKEAQESKFKMSKIDKKEKHDDHKNVSPENKQEFPMKPNWKDREEKFASQNAKKLIYEKNKKRSDSTDEDISFSLTSLVNDNIEPAPIFNNIPESSYNRDESIEEVKPKESDSVSLMSISSMSVGKNQNKIKYDKHPVNSSRSYQTLPAKKIPKNIPVFEKSKSLDKPLNRDYFTPISRSMPGSLGDIKESRYHECTETWSRQSLVEPALSKIPERFTPKKPTLDKDHMSCLKDTYSFIKNKNMRPLTNRPRPVPSYLSPVNAFPYVPDKNEYSSSDSLVDDYSADYNADEIITRYKSLPEFVTSLSTTSLPRAPISNKVEAKKPTIKKSLPETINLDYGAIENEKKPGTKKPYNRKVSANSVTTDSSYLEKPILRDRPTLSNVASSDSLSSLTYSLTTPQKTKYSNKNTKQPLQISNRKIDLQHISSLSTSSNSDPEVILKPRTNDKHSNSMINKSQPNEKEKQLSKIINGSQAQLRKPNSVPQKRIPSSSESSEYSSSSDDDASNSHRV